MRVDTSLKYLEKSQLISTMLDHNLQKLSRLIKIFRQDDPIHISVHLEKNPHKEQYFCRSHVYLPSSKVIAADESGKTVSFAVNKAFGALRRQLDKEKHKWDSNRRKGRSLRSGIQEQE